MKKTILFILMILSLLFIVTVSSITCTDDDDDDPTPTPIPTNTPTPYLRDIYGTVYDGGYNPQSGIRMLCAGKETRTDASGSYTFSDVPSGKTTVHAIWQYFSFQQTIVSNADRIDFLFRNIILITWDYGRIKGTISGMSDGYTDVTLNSVSTDHIIDYGYPDNSENYEITSAQTGENAVLATELDYYNDRLSKWTLIEGVTVNKNETTTVDLNLSTERFETVSGTLPSSFSHYGGFIESWLNFDSPPFFTFYLNPGEISAGLYSFHGTSNTSFSYQSIPCFSGATKVCQISVSNSSNYSYKSFLVSKEHASSQSVNFDQEPVWLNVSNPIPGNSNVGSYPLIEWEGDGQVFCLDFFAYNDQTNDYLDWIVITTENEFQVPEMSEFDLLKYPEVFVSIRSKSTWTTDYSVIDPPLADETDFIAKETIIIFFPGNPPSSSGKIFPIKTSEHSKSVHNGTLRIYRDKQYLYRTPTWPLTLRDNSNEERTN